MIPASDTILTLVGVTGFKALVEVHGGTRLWIPRRLDTPQGQHLVQLVGPDAACRLANEYQGSWASIPNLRALPSTEPAVHRLLGHGMTHRDIATTLKITEKTVGKHAATWTGCRKGQAA